MVAPHCYVDWLSKVDKEGGEAAWIFGRQSVQANSNRSDRDALIRDVLSSSAVKKCIKTMSCENGRDEKTVYTEAKTIVYNMAHSFGLNSTRVVGYAVLKCLKKLFDKVIVNLEELNEIRQISTHTPVVFMPTHRTYVDFLLISLLCYDLNICMPAICAGADFLTSRFVGETLRRCGAFFIRRSFDNDQLYWTLFTEYVQLHLIKNECPIEFFVEGARSRTSKSLYPRFGLVQVVAEPFLRSQVYDTIVVPVTINYDRLLESFLYGRELLGSPKPKETASGLLKVRNILDQKFGNVFITFTKPISLRSYFAHIDRALISFRPTAHYIYEQSVKKKVAMLAHDVIFIQNQHNILTVWPLSATLLLNAITNKGSIKKIEVLKDLQNFHDLCVNLGLNVWLNSTISKDFDYYLHLYSDLLSTDKYGQLQLNSVDDNSSLEMSDTVIKKAIPLLILSNIANTLIDTIADLGFVIIGCQISAERALVQKTFCFLRHLFVKEFVRVPNSMDKDFNKSLKKLTYVGILEQHGSLLTIANVQLAMYLVYAVKPFLHAYASVMQICEKLNEQSNDIVDLCRKQLASNVNDNNYLNAISLSTDLIKNVLFFLKITKTKDTKFDQSHIRRSLQTLQEIINKNTQKSRL